MFRFLLAAVFSSVAVSAQVEPFGKVLDKYECSGMGAEGRYHYTLTIEKIEDNYFFRWGNDYEGVGFLQGNRLAVVFWGGRTHGVMLYEVRPGQLVGSWAGGDGKVYSETCLSGLQARR